MPPTRLHRSLHLLAALRPALCLAFCLGLGGLATPSLAAQDDQPPADASGGSQTDANAGAGADADPAFHGYDPQTVGVDELRLRLLPLRRDELAQDAEAWIALVEEHAARYVQAQLALESAAPEQTERLQQEILELKETGARLLARFNAVVSALREKGGDVDEYKQYASTLATVLTVQRAEPQADAPKVATTEIPKLEPYDPLLVSPEELKLRLRRLRKPELTEEVETWLKRLETKTEQIAAADIAAGKAEGEAQAAMIKLSTKLKEERAVLVERAQVAIDLLEARGGEVEEYRQYVQTVSGSLIEDLGDNMGTGATRFVPTAWNILVAWATSKEGGQKVATNVGKFAATLLVAWLVAIILARLVASSLRRFNKRTSALLRDFLVTMTRRLVLLIGLVVALAKLGIDIGPLVAAIGAAGLVIGFALQGTLSNFASGILILLYRPFDVGDVVEVAGVAGKVEAMTMVSTTVTTFDNQLMVVPNNSVWNNIIKNVTGKPIRRVDLKFGISYSDDIEKARRILEEIVTSDERVLKDPAPNIRLHELGDSSVNFITRPWTRTADYWDVYWDVTRRVKERFDEEGVCIPFPQRDVHIHQAAALPAGPRLVESKSV